MSSKTVCRTCLASNIKTHDLLNTQLQEIFEKLTNSKLKTGDGRSSVCYICYCQLQRCRRFLDMAQRADQMFQEALSNPLETTEHSTQPLRVSSFIVTPVTSLSLPLRAETPPVTVKLEPTDVKDEVEWMDSGLMEPVKTDSTSPPPDEDLLIPYKQELLIENNFQTNTQTCNNNNKTNHNHCTKKNTKFYCNICRRDFSSVYSLNRHNNNKVHLRTVEIFKNPETIPNNTEPIPQNTQTIPKKTETISNTETILKNTETIPIKNETIPNNTETIPNNTQTILKNIQQISKLSEIPKTEILCNICNTLVSRNVYQSHLRKHTKPYKCEVCQKGFSELSSVRKHTATHGRVKPFTCATCHKGFTHKSFLIVHLRTHSGEKPFKCTHCDKAFAQIGHAISHRRSHEKIKPFSCDCGASFSERSTLKKHQKTHSGDRPHSCDICNKTFSERDTVASHMRTHTGEKPFRCGECGKGYSTRGNLGKHVRTHASRVLNFLLT